jgi:hypothetical protein
MFNNLGAIGNYTAPGAFRGQTFNTYTGGNLMMRSPNKVYQFAAIQFPSAKAGCGGIDVFGGSFSSHLRDRIQEHAEEHHGRRCPASLSSWRSKRSRRCLGGLTKWAKGLETWINNARINSCETAKAIVSTAAESDWLQLSGNLRRSGHRNGHGERPRCGAAALWLGSAQHSVISTLFHRPEGEKQGPLRRQPDLESLAVHGVLSG